MTQNKYSVIIDESTDISSIKSLAIVTRILDENRVKDEFLCTKEMAHADANHIHDVLVNYFNDNGIHIIKDAGLRSVRVKYKEENSL